MKSIRLGLNLRVVCVWMVLWVLAGNGVLPVFAQQPEKAESLAKVENPEEPMMLELGKAIEREVKSGQTHTYQIKMEAGQYLFGVVEQKGIDVIVEVKGLNQDFLKINSPIESAVERVHFVAETSGTYQLYIKNIELEKSGYYTVTIKEQRAATKKDRIRMAAHKITSEALFLRELQTKETFIKAIEKYNDSLILWDELGDHEGKAEAHTSLGAIYVGLGELQNALEQFRQALPIFQELGNQQREAVLINNIGVVYANLGDMRKALECFVNVLPLRRKIQDYFGEGQTLNNIGKIYGDFGDFYSGLDNLKKSLIIWKKLGNKRQEASVLNNIGVIYMKTNEVEKALQFFNDSLLLCRSVHDRGLEAIVLNNIGIIYGQNMKFNKSLNYFNESLGLRRVVNDSLGESMTLNNIGFVYLSLGELDVALAYCSQALGIQSKSGDKQSKAITLRYIGLINSKLNMKEKAIMRFKESLILIREIGNKETELAILNDLADIEYNRGNFLEAKVYIESAIAIIEKMRNQTISFESRIQFFSKAKKYYSIYLDILMKLNEQTLKGTFVAQTLQVSEQARARSLIELLTEARADIRQGVEPALIEREKDLQQRISAKSDILIRLKSTQGRETQAEAMEKEITGLTIELEEVRTEIRQKSPKYAALTQQQPLGVREIQELLDPDTVLLEYALGDERSYLWAVTKNDLNVYTLPKGKDIDEAARKCYGLLSNRNKLNMAILDAEYRRASAELSRMVLAPVGDKLNKKRIVVVPDGALQYVPFAALPVSWKTVGDKRTSGDKYLIEQSEIVYLPSATALAVQRRELKDRKPAEKLVAVVADPIFGKDDPRFPAVKPTEKPSENMGAQRDVPADKTPTPDELQLDADLRDIGLGTSKLKQSAQETELSETAGELRIPRLKFAGEEADNILSLVPATSAKKAVGFEANKTTAFDPELSKYQVVHFATHGFLNADHPELSGLVLSLVDENGNQRDGFLRAMDVFNLNLPAETVVLSACRTGLGKEIKGEGLMGLSRGFMYAGAKRLVVSLWNVNDKGTSELMTRFYRKMLKEKQRPAAALRAAQLELMREKNWSSPFFWAPFVLQGEWR